MRLILISIILMVLNACANPSIVNIKDKQAEQINNSSVIYVARFEGNPDFVEESTDFFITGLESKIPNTVIQGSVLRYENTDIINGSNIAPLNIAINIAKENKADILIIGKVTSHQTSGLINGFATVRVYNVNTGVRIANFHRPSGLLIANSEHQCVISAVNRTVKDFVEMIN